jgi:hypothetical protein
MSMSVKRKKSGDSESSWDLAEDMRRVKFAMKSKSFSLSIFQACIRVLIDFHSKRPDGEALAEGGNDALIKWAKKARVFTVSSLENNLEKWNRLF